MTATIIAVCLAVLIGMVVKYWPLFPALADALRESEFVNPLR